VSVALVSSCAPSACASHEKMSSVVPGDECSQTFGGEVGDDMLYLQRLGHVCTAHQPSGQGAGLAADVGLCTLRGWAHGTVFSRLVLDLGRPPTRKALLAHQVGDGRHSCCAGVHFSVDGDAAVLTLGRRLGIAGQLEMGGLAHRGLQSLGRRLESLPGVPGRELRARATGLPRAVDEWVPVLLEHLRGIHLRPCKRARAEFGRRCGDASRDSRGGLPLKSARSRLCQGPNVA